jgi:hypothetical protein
MTRNFLIAIASIGLLIFRPVQQLAQERTAQVEDMKPFAGTWKGICEDGSPFILLTLKVSEGSLVGEISLANMKGEDGQCAHVINPPSPEHAKKIGGPKVKNKTLSFSGSSSMQFEMSLDGTLGAKLRLLGTPVENRPWRLRKAADQLR